MKRRSKRTLVAGIVILLIGLDVLLGCGRPNLDHPDYISLPREWNGWKAGDTIIVHQTTLQLTIEPYHGGRLARFENLYIVR